MPTKPVLLPQYLRVTRHILRDPSVWVAVGIPSYGYAFLEGTLVQVLAARHLPWFHGRALSRYRVRGPGYRLREVGAPLEEMDDLRSGWITESYFSALP